MKKIVLIILGIIIILILAFVALNRDSMPTEYNDGVATEESAEFTNKLQSFVLENFGMPIDSGFSAPIYLQAFPGLMEADFDEVETAEGKYAYSDGELSFINTQEKYASTFGEAILNNGHKTLLSNLHTRLGNSLNVEEIVGNIIAQGLGDVNGTILRGPTNDSGKN